MDYLDTAKESIEQTHHTEHTAKTDPWSLRSAMLVAALAAMAVVAEMRANDAETRYLAAHISASDTWAQYQAKSIRRTVYLQSLETLGALHAPPKQLVPIRREADRMQSEPGHDGMQQLAVKAAHFQEIREHELHLHNGIEIGVRGMQIAVVLSSLFIATRSNWLLISGAVLGIGSAIYATVVAFGFL